MRPLALIAVGLLVSVSIQTGALAKGAVKADNTANNKGDERKDAVTAEKQGNDKNQVKVLAAIRKSIVHEKGLSMDAKNVKILYAGGSVTLTGPVDSEDEKAKVVELAKACPNVKSVDCQLTVAPKSH